MTRHTPRLRMFAGPNGSGKSTIKEVIPAELLGVYINPDEIEKTIRAQGLLDLADFEVKTTAFEAHDFFAHSRLLNQANLLGGVSQLRFEDSRILFDQVAINSYFASVAADFIRHKLLESKTSFTFETVMSSPDKVQFLEKAKTSGFRTYLYFVATEDPDINVSRVAYRVKTGGHPVPEDKIRKRYHHSLDLLFAAVQYTDRAYIFDNSSHERIWLAEVTNGNELEMKAEQMPLWFKTALWDKFGPDEEAAP